MKYLTFLLFLYKYSVCLVLATGLWCARWKTRTIRLNLKVWERSNSAPTSTRSNSFLFRWYLALTRDACRVLLGHHEIPLRVRPRDRRKWDRLRLSPSLFLTGHFHNWEALASWMSRSGIPLLGSARRLSSPWAEARLRKLRLRNQVPVVSEQVLPRALSHLRSGGCFGILWDQFSPYSRHTSLLFGQPATMDPLPETLVRRLAPEVFVGFLLPSGEVRIFSILPPGSSLPNPGRLSSRYHRLLELVVRAHPTHWYGLCHARFKDTLDYGSDAFVSRETLEKISASGPYVSRETQGRNHANLGQG